MVNIYLNIARFLVDVLERFVGWICSNDLYAIQDGFKCRDCFAQIWIHASIVSSASVVVLIHFWGPWVVDYLQRTHYIPHLLYNGHSLHVEVANLLIPLSLIFTLHLC